MVIISDKILDKTTEKAQNSKRLRMNYNYHPKLDDLLQRMLNAVEPNTYIQPHKHENPDKTEVFMVLRGKILVVEFDDSGNIKEHILLDADSGNYAAEILPRTWHSIISLEKGSVAYEIKNGPYNPIDDKNFASWAPKEGDIDSIDYLNSIIMKCGLNII